MAIPMNQNTFAPKLTSEQDNGKFLRSQEHIHQSVVVPKCCLENEFRIHTIDSVGLKNFKRRTDKVDKVNA